MRLLWRTVWAPLRLLRLAASGQDGLERADAAAALLQIVHLLGVAQPDLPPAVLRVEVERRAGDDRHAAALEDDARRLLVILEAEIADIGEHVIRPLRRERGHAGLAAGLDRHVALPLVVAAHVGVVRLRQGERRDDAVLPRRRRAAVGQGVQE